MLLKTAAEAISHVGVLAAAMALNLESVPTAERDTAASMSPMVNAVMGGMGPRKYLSAVWRR